LWLHSLKVAQLLRSAACLHTNQSRSYLNHLVDLLNFAMSTATRSTQINDAFILQAKNDKIFVVGNYFLVASVLWSARDVLQLPRMSPCFAGCLNQETTGRRSLRQYRRPSRAASYTPPPSTEFNITSRFVHDCGAILPKL